MQTVTNVQIISTFQLGGLCWYLYVHLIPWANCSVCKCLVFAPRTLPLQTTVVMCDAFAEPKKGLQKIVSWWWVRLHTFGTAQVPGNSVKEKVPCFPRGLWLLPLPKGKQRGEPFSGSLPPPNFLLRGVCAFQQLRAFTQHRVAPQDFPRM